MEEKTSNKVISNMLWRFSERIAAQGVSFIVSIILARLLTPSDYGTVSLIMVFLAILQVFVDSGLGTALIQKQIVDDTDYSTVFFFNFGICICLYMLLFLFAPFIAKFYNDVSMTPLIRVAGLTLIISGVKGIQQAYVSKHLLFKKFFYSTLSGTAFSAIIGIILAYKGFGCWAIVIQQISNALIDTSILWLTVKWRPKLLFSFKRLKILFSYGVKMLISSLLDTGYNNLRNLVIGKVYSASNLAYFNKGQQIPLLVVNNINTSIDSVLLPVMSSAQDNQEHMKSMTRRAIKTSSFIMWPAMVGLAVCAEPITIMLLTEKWINSVFFLRVFCFTYVLWPIHTANLNAIKAMGRSDIFLQLEIIKKFIGIVSIVIAIPFGIKTMAIAYFLTSPISAFLNAYPNKKLLNYGYKEQIIDILPATLLSFFMGGVVLLWTFIDMSYILMLICQIITGMLIYIVGSRLLKLESYSYIINMIKSFKNKKKNL